MPNCASDQVMDLKFYGLETCLDAMTTVIILRSSFDDLSSFHHHEQVHWYVEHIKYVYT